HALTGVEDVTMMMAAEQTPIGGPLRLALVTAHMPLRDVPDAMTIDLVTRKTRVAIEALRGWWGIPRPRITFAGLNPHAGEGGLFGDEEAEVFQPALEALSEDRDLEVRLRKVLYRIVAFRELSVYPFLRVDDRVHMRSLLKDILDWLNSDTRDPEKARNLWRDLAGFAELLVQVSHRQELQDHDRELLRRAYNRLFLRDGHQQLTPALLDELASLLGLDDELDLLISNRIRNRDVWRAPMERELRRLEKGPAPTARIDLLGSFGD
ncbi:MAG: 4-hydroxythreonine-4-phosphate dehydrogenase PdxA, partial [Holophagales bacterium]|nr:4-hydroxythreonine-4-phosphate dehydrogenase PdxA [Holophagales bacterium]